MADLKQNLNDLSDWFISKIRGKAPSQIHNGDKFQKTRQETANLGVYENSFYKLKPDSFAKKYAGTISLVLGIRKGYSFFSVASALMTGYLLAEFVATGLSFWLYWLSIFALMSIIFTLAIFVEMMKETSAKGVFKTNANASKPEEKATNSAWLKMCFFTAISIAISAVGGAEFSRRLNDNTISIDSAYSGKADSIKALYLDQIKVYEDIIASNQEILTKNRIASWQKNISNQAIAAAQKSKMDIMQSIDSKILEINQQNKSDLLTDTAKNKNLALKTAGIISVLEILFIFSFAYEFWYWKGCKEEAINHQIISKNWYLQNIEGSDLALIVGADSTDYPKNYAPTARQEQPEIGFKQGSKNPTNFARRTHCIVCSTALDGRSDKIVCSKKCYNIYYQQT